MQKISVCARREIIKGIAVLFYASMLCADPEPVIVTIFIHGTVGSAIEVVKNPSMFFKKSDCAHEKNPDQQKYRELRLHEEEQLIGPCELTKLQSDIIADYRTYDDSAKHVSPYAQYHLASAYDALLEKTYPEVIHREYYLFGWSGRFSQAARHSAACELHDALKKLRDQYYTRGMYPVFNIEAHSHGGTVAVVCGELAAQQEDPVLINYAALYGMPVSTEIKKGLESSALRAVYQFHSPHDQLQKADALSTPDGKSTAQIHDVLHGVAIDEMLIRVDVAVEGDPKAPVDHVNMWKIGRSHLFAPLLDPLPFFVMSPLIIRNLGKLPRAKNAVVKIEPFKDSFSVTVEVGDDFKQLSHEIEETLTPLIPLIKKRWRPTDTSRSVIFNKQLFVGLKIMLGFSS